MGARIGGSVSDPSQALVASALVVAENQATGDRRATRTDSSGYYVFPILDPGIYRVTATAPGFLPATRRDIRLSVGADIRVDVSLTVAGSATSVAVPSEAILLDTESATQGQTIGARAIAELPLNRRDFLSLALLAPGVAPPTYGSFTAKLGGAVHVSGSREMSNMYLLDGVENSNPFLNTIAFSPPLSAIDEFKIHIANASTGMGRLSGGQIDVALKSGSNSLHGNVLGFLRNRNLDARNFFEPPACSPGLGPTRCADRTALDRKQFGGGLGGPLLRDRTFYFASYEGFRLRQGWPRQSTVPSRVERNAALANVPVAERSPAGLAALNLFPAANADLNDPASNVFLASPLVRDSIDQGLLKLDHLWSANRKVTAHFGIFDQRRTEPYDITSNFTTLPGFGVRIPARALRVGLGFTETRGPHWVLDTRLAWNRPTSANVPLSQGRNLNEELGFPTVTDDPELQGSPSIFVAGFTALGEGRALPANRESSVWSVAHNASWTTDLGGASHLIRFGGAFRTVDASGKSPLYARGFWNFLGGFGTPPLEDLVRGRPTRAIAGKGEGATDVKAWSGSLYVGDDLHLGRSLSVQLGLRYEYNSPPVSTGAPFTVPDLRPESANCVPKPTCLLVAARELGLPAATFRPDRNNFAPRVGLAWRPSRALGLVVRSAYGVFFENAALHQTTNYALNPPFLSVLAYGNDGTRTIPNSLTAVPAESLALEYRLDPNLRDAYVQQWNLGLQWGLAPGWVLETAYVGTKGTRLSRSVNLNQPPEGGGTRPYPQHGPVLSVASQANSNYHGLQTRLERRLSSGANLLAAYTWSKSIDDASLYTGLAQAESYTPQDSRTLRGERALSTFHTGHRLSATLLQRLPAFRDRSSFVRAALGGWQAAVMAAVSSGHPFPILRSQSQSGTGFGPLGDASDRPDAIGDPMRAGPLPNHPDPACRLTTAEGGKAAVAVRTPGSWFNPCAFAAPNTARFGNSARNNVIGPGVAQVDASLGKFIRLPGERVTLQLRFEAFNLLNTPQFDLPEHRFDAARFGAISSSNALGSTPPRQIQIGAQFTF